MSYEDCSEVNLKSPKYIIYSEEYDKIMDKCPCKECLVKMMCVLKKVEDCNPYFEHWVEIQEYLKRI